MTSRAHPLCVPTNSVSTPARTSPRIRKTMGRISTAGCLRTVMTWRSSGSRYLLTLTGAVGPGVMRPCTLQGQRVNEGRQRVAGGPQPVEGARDQVAGARRLCGQVEHHEDDRQPHDGLL